MKQINRRESQRIAIQLRCHVTSPALWMRSAMHTENISRSGMLVAWRGESAALPPPATTTSAEISTLLQESHSRFKTFDHVAAGTRCFLGYTLTALGREL